MEEPKSNQSGDGGHNDKTEQIAADARDKMAQATDDFDDRLNDLTQRAGDAAQRYRAQQAKVNKERKSEGESARGLGYGLTYAYALIGGPIVGFGIGYLIDSATGSENYKNWLAVIGTVLGFVGMLVIMNRDNKRNS